MNGTGAFIVKVIFSGAGHVLMAGGASFGLADVLLGERQEGIRGWFRQRWAAVSRSRWVRMPERVIEWLLGLERRIRARFPGALEHLTTSDPTLVAVFAVVCVVSWQTWGILVALAIGTVSSALLVCLFSQRLRNELTHAVARGSKIARLAFGTAGVVFLFWIYIGVLGLKLLLELPTSVAIVLMIASLPVLLLLIWGIGAMLYMFRGHARERALRLGDLFAMGVAASFLVTLVAFLVGRSAQPGCWVPQTLQMLLSNVFFDGLTLVATFAILSWAVARPGLFRIPAAVFVDLIIGALLACASLYFGLVFTDKGLSVGEVFRVLIARSPAGDTLDFGPYFWAMHTTFLPTLGYLAVIFACWLGKAMLIPVQWFFGKGQELKNPLRLTAVLCTLIAALFYLGSWVVAFFVS